MKQQEILEGNKLIAKFLNHNYDVVIHGELCGLGSAMEKVEYKLNYHKDWKLLMPVVEKIESLGFSYQINGLHGRVHYCWFHKYDEEGNDEQNPIGYNGKLDESLISAMYNAILQFIKWFNENK